MATKKTKIRGAKIEGGLGVEMVVWVDSLGYINFTTWSGYKHAKKNRFWINPMEGAIVPGSPRKWAK